MARAPLPEGPDSRVPSRVPSGAPDQAGTDLYRVAAPIYDLCTALWSGGAIWRSRRCQIEAMQPGESVLYAGGGTGRAAVEAARRGMRVTLADRSPAMLAKAQARALRAGVEIEWLQTDLWDYQPEVRFDHVCANHFFNVYGEADMQRMRARLMGWLVPGGSLHIADFRPLVGGRLARMAQRVHHAIPLAGCSAFTRNALHPIYDHDRWGEQQPGRLQVQDHRMWWIGPGWYRTWRLETESRTPAQPT